MRLTRNTAGGDPGDDVGLRREIEPPLDALQVGTDCLWCELQAPSNHHWLQAVRDNLSPLEKVVASFAHKRKDLKLGEINITKL